MYKQEKNMYNSDFYISMTVARRRLQAEISYYSKLVACDRPNVVKDAQVRLELAQKELALL